MSPVILNQYVKLVEFLGNVLGEDYEIALHDLSIKERSIIAIANGHVSGRSVGAPLTDLALEIISNNSYKKSDFRINYQGLSAENKILRSSTMFIKDSENRLIGLLCINFDGSKYRKLSQDILELCNIGALPTSPLENFSDSITGLTKTAISNILSEQKIDLHNETLKSLSHKTKISIVEGLSKKGIFELKGAVNAVATELCCSIPTIYRYLKKIK